MDSTAVRLTWAVPTIFPGAIVCGVIAYVVAWLVMLAAAVTPTPPPPTSPEAEVAESA